MEMSDALTRLFLSVTNASLYVSYDAKCQYGKQEVLGLWNTHLGKIKHAATAKQSIPLFFAHKPL